MLVSLDNYVTIENPSESVMEYCERNLTLDNPDYINALKRNSYAARSIAKKLFLYKIQDNKYILPFGTFKDIVSLGIPHTQYTNAIRAFTPQKIESSIILYDYQQKALDRMKTARNGILVANCGSGKTQIGLQLIAELGGKALWITHTGDLLAQSYNRAKQTLKCSLGKITEGKVDIQDITFATVQTLVKIDLEEYKRTFDVIVVDECHHAVGSPTKMKMFYKIVSSLSARYKYGLTATPTRADGLTKAMYALLGNKEFEITRESVGEKIVDATYEPIMWEETPPKVYRGRDIITNEPIYQYDFIDTDGTYMFSKLISTLSEWKERNEFIVKLVKEHPGRHILVLCNLVSHAKALAHDLGAELLVGSKSKGDRKEAIESLKSGKSKIAVATVSLVKEGLDIPILDTLIFATPQKNPAIVVQSIGRIERSFPGKLEPIVYDIVDTQIPYCMGSYSKRKGIMKRRNKK